MRSGKAVYVFDANIQDVESLILGLPEGSEWILLPSTGDGLKGLADALSGFQDITALHVYGHGRPGTLSLGGSLVTLSSLDQNADILAEIGSRLSPSGDLLFYACHLAGNASGIAFIERVAVLTGADVVASSDQTGAADHQGNWDLEVTTGAIEASATGNLTWAGSLAALDQEATGTLTVMGVPQQGGVLEAVMTDLVDADGATTTAFRWQAYVDGAWIDLSGQTSATLNIPSDQSYVGKVVRILATTTDDLGGTTVFASASQTIANVNDVPMAADSYSIELAPVSGRYPDIAAVGDGSVLLVWRSAEGWGWYSQRVSGDGTVLSGPTLIANPASWTQFLEVLPLADGSYLVAGRIETESGGRTYAWNTIDYDGNQSQSRQIVDPNGPWSYGTDGLILQNNTILSVSHYEGGGPAWDVGIDLLTPTGQTIATNIPITAENGNSQFVSEAKPLADGKSVLIVWSDLSGALDPQGWGIHGRIFSTETRTFVTAPFLINQDTAGDESATENFAFGGSDTYALVALNDGGFAVFWRDGTNGYVQGRFFNSAAQGYSARSDEFIASKLTPGGTQRFVDGDALPSGGVAIVYESITPNGSVSIVLRVFDASGQLLKDEIALGSADSINARPRITVVSDALIAVTWQMGEAGSDPAALQVHSELVSIAEVLNDPSPLVVIQGASVQGQTLTAITSGIADADGLGPFSYVWKADGVAIPGAASSTLFLSQAQVGKLISVEVSYTDGQGTDEGPLLRLATAAVENVDDEATGTLSVSGDAAEGGTLTASLSDVTDIDGTTTTAYRWQENVGGTWTDLADGNSATLAIPSDQSFVGKIIRVVATTTDVLGGTTEFLSASQNITNVNDTPTGLPVVIGLAASGGTLIADASGISDADGLGALAYVWKADGAAIAGATSGTLLLGEAQVGKTITVEVSYTDLQGTAEGPLTSSAVQVSGYLVRGTSRYSLVYGETWNQARANAQALGGDLVIINDQAENDWIVSNYANKGHAGLWIGLTDTNVEGQWEWASGDPLTYSNWFAGEPNNNSSYSPTGEDYAHLWGDTSLGGVAGGWNDSGNDAFIWSGRVFVGVVEMPLVDTEATGTLTVSGSAQEGGALTANLSNISDPDGATTTAYRWQEYVGGNWVDLAGTGSATLTIPSDETYFGKLVRVVATTTDVLGGATEFIGDELAVSQRMSWRVSQSTTIHAFEAGESGPHGKPVLGRLASGEVVVVSSAHTSNASDLQYSTLAGDSLAELRHVNLAEIYYQGSPDVVVLGDRAFVSYDTTPQNYHADQWGFFIDANGDRTSPSPVMDLWGGADWAGAIARFDDGSMVVTFQSERGNGYDIYAQNLAADGQRIGDTYTVSEGLSNNQYSAVFLVEQPLATVPGSKVFASMWTNRPYGDGRVSPSVGLRLVDSSTGNRSQLFDLDASQDGYGVSIVFNSNGDGVAAYLRNSALYLRSIRGALADPTLGNEIALPLVIEGIKALAASSVALSSGLIALVTQATDGLSYWVHVAIFDPALDSFTSLPTLIATSSVAVDSGLDEALLPKRVGINAIADGADLLISYQEMTTQTIAVARVVSFPEVADAEATGTLTVAGVAEEGGVLVADLANVTDDDGPTTTAYRWQENAGGTWTDLAGQASATLSIPSDQSFVGKSVRVVATTTDELGGTTEFTSASQAITNVNDAPSGTVGLSLRLIGAPLGPDDITDPSTQTYNPSNGHIYERVNAELTWSEAKLAAEAKSIGGVTGFLATVTSQEENDFLFYSTGANYGPDRWLGGEFDATDDRWEWVTGPDAGEAIVDFFWWNWQPEGTHFRMMWWAPNWLRLDANVRAGSWVEYEGSTVVDEPLSAGSVVTEGDVLKADLGSLIDDDGYASANVQYQWKADGTVIAGATSSTLVLTQAEVGKAITVEVSYMDGQGTNEGPLVSLATAAVANVDDEATGTLAVTGPAQEGGTLVATLTDVVDIDGATATAYRWQENVGGTWTDLFGQSAATLNIPSDQSYVGKSVRVVATTTDVLGGTTEFTSTAQTIANVNDAPTGLPTISGVATHGQILSANTSGIADADGLGTFSYVWNADGTPIAGATSSTLLLGTAHVGKRITVEVRYTDGQGTAEGPLASVASDPVTGLLTPLTTGADVYVAPSDAAVMIDGLAGNDAITTRAGNDIVRGNAGDDTIDTGAGDDVIRFSGTTEGFDAVNGGTGTDRIEALVNNTVIGLRSLTGIERITASGRTGVWIRGSVGNDVLDFSAVTLEQIVRIDGDRGNDTITGSALADTLLGGVGNDVLSGGDGDDLFQVAVGGGTDAIQGGAGTDRVVALAANTVIGLSAFSGLEEISANGFTGVRIAGTAVADTLDFSATTLTGITLIDGGAGDDTITGSAGADVIFGNLGLDTIRAGDGDDVIQFNAATTDIVDGGAGNNTLVAIAANASIVWTNVTNVQRMEGGAFAGVAVVGTAGNDAMDLSAVTLVNIARIDGGAGNDTITGSAGADTIMGGTGNDSLNGGDGNDAFQIGTGSGIDAIHGGAGTDRVVALAANTVIGLSAISGVEEITANGFAGVRLVGTTANDVLDLSAVTLTAIALIDGGAGNDSITGSAGADVIFGNLGTDTIRAGDGDDTIQFGAATLDVVDGGAGSNRLVANAANASIVWPSVTNVQRVEGGAFAGVALMGTAGADLIDLSSVTLVNVVRIDAAAGNDTIRGSTGADTLFGGTGADQLTGGAGADIFGVRLVTESRAAGGIDVISDFTLGSDRLDLSAIDASTTVAGNQAFSFIGTSAFSGVAGQLRIDTTTAGRTKVLGDINGDRLTDLELHLLWSDPNTPLVVTSSEIVL